MIQKIVVLGSGSAGLIAARLRGVRLGTLRRERWLWVANALLSFCISYGVVYWCEQWVPSGLASVLFSTFPLFVAIMSHFTLPEERLTLRGAIGVLLGVADGATVRVWDTREGVELAPMELATAAVTAIAFDRRRRVAAVGDASGHVWLFIVETGRTLGALAVADHAEEVTAWSGQ